MRVTPYQPAHSSKPDPDEPWRYVCPDCRGQVYHNDDRAGSFRCPQCRDTHPPRELYDKLTTQRRGAT